MLKLRFFIKMHMNGIDTELRFMRIIIIIQQLLDNMFKASENKIRGTLRVVLCNHVSRTEAQGKIWQSSSQARVEMKTDKIFYISRNEDHILKI